MRAGPGAKDLITLRGVQRLQETDVIHYTRLIDPEILGLARRDAERVYVGKAPGCHHGPQDKITGVLVATARQGKRLVRLKCGDPGVFAHCAEEAQARAAAGIVCKIVPGITAASAASAVMGDLMTERGMYNKLVFVTGQSENNAIQNDWAALLRPDTRPVIYVGPGNAPDIAAALARCACAEGLKVDIVANAQHPDQIIAHCGLSGPVEGSRRTPDHQPRHPVFDMALPQNRNRGAAFCSGPDPGLCLIRPAYCCTRSHHRWHRASPKRCSPARSRAC